MLESILRLKAGVAVNCLGAADKVCFFRPARVCGINIIFCLLGPEGNFLGHQRKSRVAIRGVVICGSG